MAEGRLSVSFHIAGSNPSSSLKIEARWGGLDWAKVLRLARGLYGTPILVP